MTRTLFAAALALIAVGTAVPAFAGTDTPRIDQREINQQKRIANGVSSGQLTPNETKRLENGEQRILNAEQKAKADGTVTKGERRRLTAAQDAESRRIARLKHNNRTTP